MALTAIAGCKNVGSRPPSDAEILVLKSKCKEAGQKTRLEWIVAYPQDIFANEPEYGYVQSLHTCVWIDEYWGPPLKSREHVKFVLDVFSNKIVIEYKEHDGRQSGALSEAEFNRRKVDLVSP